MKGESRRLALRKGTRGNHRIELVGHVKLLLKNRMRSSRVPFGSSYVPNFDTKSNLGLAIRLRCPG